MGKDQFKAKGILEATLRVEALSPPKKKKKIENGEWVQMVSELEGVSSCYPTTLLNAMLYQNYVSHDEAVRVQQELARGPKYESLWAVVQREGESMKVWATDASALTRVINDMLGYYIPIEFVDIRKLGNISEYMSDKLFSGYAVVGGSIEHCFLASTYNDFTKETYIVDPRFAKHPYHQKVDLFANLCKENGWINIV